MVITAILLISTLMIILGFPIIISLLFPSIIYVIIFDLNLSIIAYNFYKSLNSFPLVAIPLFIFMGVLINNFNLSERILELAKAIFRGKKGYSLKMNVLASVLFSGMSGTAVADVGALGKVQVKATEKEGFSKEFGSAFTIASASIGPMFPPSVPLILYALVAQTSSVQSLLAGVFPALVIALLLYVYALYKIRKTEIKTNANVDEKKNVIKVFTSSFPIIIMVPLIIVAMLSGILSPTEVGAAAVGYIIILSFIYREFKIKTFIDSTKETLETTGRIVILLAVGTFYTSILMREGLAQNISDLLLSTSDSQLILLLVVVVGLLIIGMFIEGLVIIVLITPLLLPTLIQVGVNPIHFGVIATFSIMIGMLTPPFGISLFTISEVAKVSSFKVIKELMPFYLVLFIALLIITLFPQISLWLPSLVF